MVDFNSQNRKRCRHCKMNLPEPTSNERQAFCTRGRYQSFYLHRCIVCEKAIERTTANRKICKKSKCRNALAAAEGFGRYHADLARTYQSPKNPELMQKTLIPCGSASASDTVARSNRVCANFGIDQAIRANRARIVGPKRVLDVEIGGWERIRRAGARLAICPALAQPAFSCETRHRSL
jgi:hypothetical protein